MRISYILVFSIVFTHSSKRFWTFNIVNWNFIFLVVAQITDATYSVKSAPFLNADVTIAEIGVEFAHEPHIAEPVVCPPHNFTCGTVDISNHCNYMIQNITLCKEGTVIELEYVSNVSKVAEANSCIPEYCDNFPASIPVSPYNSFEILEFGKVYNIVDQSIENATTVDPVIAVFKFNITNPCTGLHARFRSKHGNAFWNIYYYDDVLVWID